MAHTNTKEMLLQLWEDVKQLNLDVGLKQRTLDDVQSAIQHELNELYADNYEDIICLK